MQHCRQIGLAKFQRKCTRQGKPAFPWKTQFTPYLSERWRGGAGFRHPHTWNACAYFPNTGWPVVCGPWFRQPPLCVSVPHRSRSPDILCSGARLFLDNKMSRRSCSQHLHQPASQPFLWTSPGPGVDCFYLPDYPGPPREQNLPAVKEEVNLRKPPSIKVLEIGLKAWDALWFSPASNINFYFFIIDNFLIT